MNTTERTEHRTEKQIFINSTSCDHPYLKTDKKTRNKVCTSCGAVIYTAVKHLPVYLAIPE
ncbi:MAG: hypothetical protein ACXVDU_15780 [Bacteroidia bacterium]